MRKRSRFGIRTGRDLLSLQFAPGFSILVKKEGVQS